MVNDRVPDVGVVAPEMVGAAGIVRGVDETAFESDPEPYVFTTRSFTLYAVPFASELDPDPEIVEMTTGENKLAGLRAAHVEPPSVEYSMFVNGDPPFAPVVKATVN
jgi:hypothetical protein